MKIVLHKNINIEVVSENADTLYIIDDNNQNTIYNNLSQNGLIDNVLYIRTKLNPTKRSSSFFNDNNFDEHISELLSDFFKIKYATIRYKKVSLSEYGYGNYMEKQSPMIYTYLSSLLYQNFGFDNKNKTYEKRIPSYNEIIKAKTIDISHYNPIKLELIKNFKCISISIDDKVEFGDILKFKHESSKDELICKVNIPSYDISNINNNLYNLFEGYTKPKNKYNLQFHFEYIASVNNGVITFANESINKETDKVTNNKEQKRTELVKTEDKVDEIKQDEIVIDNKSKDINTNWFVENISLEFFLKSITDDDNLSILDMNDNNYLVLSNNNLFKISNYKNKFKLLDKIEISEYKLSEIFDTTFLFIKEKIHNEFIVKVIKIENINKRTVDMFLKSKL